MDGTDNEEGASVEQNKLPNVLLSNGQNSDLLTNNENTENFVLNNSTDENTFAGNEKEMQLMPDNKDLSNILPVDTKMAAVIANDDNMESVEKPEDKEISTDENNQQMVKSENIENLTANDQTAGIFSVKDEVVPDLMSNEGKLDAISAHEGDENVPDSEKAVTNDGTTADMIANDEKVNAALPIDEHEKSTTDSQNSDKSISDNKTAGNLSVDEEKLSNMGAYDLTLTDVIFNDEASTLMLDARNTQPIMINNRKSVDAISTIENVKSIGDTEIAQERTTSDDQEEVKELSAPDNQTETMHNDAGSEDAVPKDIEEAEADPISYDEDIESINEESFIIDDGAFKDLKIPKKAKANLLIDKTKAVDIIPDNIDGQEDLAFKSETTPTILVTDHPSEPMVDGDNAENLPINTETTTNLLADEEKSKELLIDVDEQGTDKENSFARESKRKSSAAIMMPLNTLVLDDNLGVVGLNERPKSNVGSIGKNQEPKTSRSNTEHTIVDLSKVTDISADDQQPEDATVNKENIADPITNEESLGFLTNGASSGKFPVDDTKVEEPMIDSEQIDQTSELHSKMASLPLSGGNVESLNNTENLISDAEKPEDIPAGESTSLLNEGIVTRSGTKRAEVISSGRQLDTVNVENETIGAMIANGKRSAIMAGGRRTNRLSYIDSAHVIQINSSKETHMRALPSEKFWRRNQRRVSTMPAVEEGQMAQT
jgi:hypothetical protein